LPPELLIYVLNSSEISKNGCPFSCFLGLKKLSTCKWVQEVLQYPLATAPGCIQYPMANGKRLMTTLRKIYQRLWQSSDKTAGELNICLRVATVQQLDVHLL
jgi:hypothetical protein